MRNRFFTFFPGRARAGLLCILHSALCTYAAPDPLTVSDLTGAGRVAGVEFTEKESEQMLKKVTEQMKSLAPLRARSIPNSLSPALIFDPRPVGFQMPPAQPFDWNPPHSVELPKDHEDLAFFPVADLAALLRARKVTSEELTRLSLQRLKRYGPHLHCTVTLTEDRALTAARRADTELREGKWRGPLHGVPYGVKDLLDVAGTASTWGVSLYTNQIAARDATVVKKLDEAGAVLVAKFSLGELAMGDIWFGGLTRNPWKPETGSSGSSAGSGSAVAAGLVPFAIGSETLGSIVSPAAVCGITGLRPTYGRVSRAGAMTLCYSLDKLGPLARSAEDCALVLNIIRGTDGEDRSVIDASFNVPDAKKLRVGFLESDFKKDYANKTNDLAALEVLRGLGFELKPVVLPTNMPRGALFFLLSAEAATSFDELTRSNQDDTLVQQADSSWPNSFRAARFITAIDYLQANRVRTDLMLEMDAIFQQVDVLVTPVWQGNQLHFSNMTGIPCVAVPNGELGLKDPPSFCFLARLFREGNAVALARAYQNATDWHKRKPDLTAVEKIAP